MDIIKPNRLGWVTDMSYEVDIGHLLTFSLHGVVSAEGTQGLHFLMMDWMNDGIRTPSFQQEWMCLYCASPNSIHETHCTQCGAPRNFILG